MPAVKPEPAPAPEDAPAEAVPQPRTAATAAPAIETPEDLSVVETRSGGHLFQSFGELPLADRLLRLWPHHA